LAVAMASLIHAIIYIILIRSSSGEKGVLKHIFSHKKKEDEVTSAVIKHFN
jgi:hypothetical protein